MHNTIERPVARIAMLPQRFTVDAGVRARAKESTRLDRSGFLWFASHVFPVFAPPLIVLGTTLMWQLNGLDFFDFLHLKFGVDMRFSVAVLVLGATLIIVRSSYVRDMDNPRPHLIVKRKIRAQLRGAKRAAKLVDANVLPVLTIEHVDALARVNKVLREQHAFNGPLVWDQTNAERIAALLFEDLDREDTITGLITARNMTTHAEISEALRGMEASGKALNEGWL